jgi:hypothetical protein
MIGSPRSRGGEEAAPFEGSLRSPAQLAFAMPLIAVAALMLVVCALVLGGSTQLVAIVAVGGFGLCALAPMALIDIFVGRPLRAAAARLRAARDGRPIQESAPFAAGIVADLVHLADDIRAGHAQIGKYGATLTQCEKMLAAGEEAIRGFRLQSEELAQATALGDSQLRRASQAQFAEIAEAVKALRATTPAGNLDGAVERIEAMLVYVAEALDRRDANDKVVEGAFGRVERSFTELGRLVTRETEALQRSVSNSAVSVRNDLALAETEDTTARARVIERIETAEARLLAKLVDAAPPDTARTAELIRAESEATRRALRDKLEETSQKLDAAVLNLSRSGAADDPRARDELQRITSALAAASETLARNLARLDATPPAATGVGELLARGLAEIGERLSAETTTQAERLEAVESRVVQQILAIERDAESTTLTALMRTTKQLGEAVQKLEAAGTAKGAEASHASAQLQALGKTVEAIAERLEAASLPLAAEARDAFSATSREIAAMREGLEAARGEFAAAASDSAVLRLDFAAHGASVGEALETLVARVEAAVQIEAGRLQQGLGAVSAATEAAARQTSDGFAETAHALRAEIDALAARLLADVAAAAGQIAAQAQNGFELSASQAAAAFAAAQARLEASAERLDAGAGAAELAALRAQFQEVIARIDALDEATARSQALAQAETEARWARLAARFDAGATAVAGMATREAADFEALRTALDRIEASVMQASADLGGELRSTVSLQAERVVARLEAFDRDVFASALAGLETAGRQLEELPVRLGAAAERIDRGAETLAGADLDIAGLRAEFGGLSAQVSARLDEVARDLAGKAETPPWAKLDPAVAAIQAVTTEFCKAGAQLSTSAEALKLAAADRPAFAALREDVAAVAAALARLGERAEAALRAAADQAHAFDGRAEGRAREADRRLESLENGLTAALQALAGDAGATLRGFAQPAASLEAAAPPASAGHALDAFDARFAAFPEASRETSLGLDRRLADRAAGDDRASAA